jgi:hypothetical protein
MNAKVILANGGAVALDDAGDILIMESRGAWTSVALTPREAEELAAALLEYVLRASRDADPKRAKRAAAAIDALGEASVE